MIIMSIISHNLRKELNFLFWYFFLFTVSQATFFFINGKFLSKYLDYIEQFTLLFSALGHDVSHTGRTNAFEVATLSKLAIKYNDESVRSGENNKFLTKKRICFDSWIHRLFSLGTRESPFFYIVPDTPEA